MSLKKESDPSRGGSPTPSLRTSLRQLSQEKRAKKIRFYRNGDRFFTGLIYALSLERIRSWDALLEDLTRILVDQVNLPAGVRHVFGADGRHDKIASLDQFREGASYVCSSTDHFVKLDYTGCVRPQWRLTARKLADSLIAGRSDWAWQKQESRSFVRPKIVAVLKSGAKPRKVVRLVLNRRTAFSFEQVLSDITRRLECGAAAVRRIFSLAGQPVTCLADFFQDDDIFIAYGPDKLSDDDFVLDSEECKFLSPTSGRHGQKKSRRASPHSHTPGRRLSSPAIRLPEGLVSDSSYHSSRSSLSSSPRLTRKVRAKSPNKNGYYETGFLHLPSYRLPPQVYEKYDVGKVIGDGNFAVVHQCTERKTSQEFALKIIDKNKCRGKEHIIANEVGILRLVRGHANIVHLYKEYDIGSELYLVMELVKGGDLFDAIASVSKYEESLASGMLRDLGRAVAYLHGLSIAHRDIKPENLLVGEDGHLKLADFGLAVEVTGQMYTVCGTPTYVAPEILAESGYGLKVDIWAAGVIAYILLCGFPPFVNASNSQEELFEQILAGNYEFTSPYWDHISNTAKEFIVGLLQVEPVLRLSAEQMLQHPWLDPARDHPPSTTMVTSLNRHNSYIRDDSPYSKESWILTPSSSSEDS